MFQKGDRVKITNEESSFGIVDGRYVKFHIPRAYNDNGFIIVDTGIEVRREKSNVLSEPKKTDLLIKDEAGNYFFVSSKLVELASPEISIRYYSNGRDVTKELSDESKLAVRKAHD